MNQNNARNVVQNHSLLGSGLEKPRFFRKQFLDFLGFSVQRPEIHEE